MKKPERISEIIYFSMPGPANTLSVLKTAARRAKELGIEEILVATETGSTALKAAGFFPEGKVIAVTYHSGAGRPFDDPLPKPARRRLEGAGALILTCSHALSGAERGLFRKGGRAPLDLVADSLRMLGQGAKVAVEISLMAADAGVLSGNDLIAIGGSAKGADTALVISPAHSKRLFDLWIREIICKPRRKSAAAR